MADSNEKQVVWAPWRMEYILGEKEQGCIFCTRIRQTTDRDNFIVARGQDCFVILNRYPYNNGHLMVVPVRHVGSLVELTSNESQDVMHWLQRSIAAMSRAFQPHGFNLGMNLGKVAGAGVDDHIHFHIVPRWDADTNFMPIIADTKVIAESLAASYDKLQRAFCDLEKEKGVSK